MAFATAEEYKNMAGNFIHDIIDEDLATGKHTEIVTRFPPEPNGYLHIGHAKSLCLNFGTALKYGGRCNLRYDDTNPTKEDIEFVKSIEADVNWLGFQWDEKLWASDYFDTMYDAAVELIKQGKALGVFTWLLISAGHPVEFLDLIETNSDCAFLLFCKPEEITQSFLDEVQSIHNLMFVVRCEPEAVQACDHLREREYLYSIYIPYRSEEASSIVNEDILSTAENLHPVFTFFTPGEPSCEEQQKAVYQQVLQVRASQQYQTILIDLIYDNRAIDGVISDDSCEVEFRKDGTLYAPDTTGHSALTLFEQPLENILRCAFPKTT